MIRTNLAILSFIEQTLTSEEKEDRVFLKGYAPGEHLLMQGQGNKYVFIQKEGISKCYITEANGKEFIIEFLGEGELMGEIEIIRKTKNVTSIAALTPVTSYCITYDFFSKLMTQYPVFNQLLLQALAARVSETSARASYQQIYPAEYTMMKLFSLLANQQVVLPKKDLADYLAVSLRSFNRTIKQLREKRILSPHSFDLYIDGKMMDKLLLEYDQES
ncbi:Crp/Fnr family transcriptional regulator [Chitinophaga solisilvae]|uniref:Crp/Fnr family transcriptional regulator n=1 Tax=Chitinophaga solisilvae TaxID=1233460 RepID=A0A433WLT5_9BACT|nr:Crp/Fnr family transcriptional regulator [Chitinophaga solisilvae]NSL90801.1 Crp/Fnr family transcriptional regulator [Chitinophaga solisilvae]